MTRPGLVVFDMIGTTVRSSDKIPEAFRLALASAGVELSADDISGIRGKSKRAAIEELLAGKCDTDAVYAAFKSHLRDGYTASTVEALPGAEETFAWCRHGGTHVALTTGFDSEVARVLIDKLGWQNQVDAVVCNDDVKQGRPAPDLIFAAMSRLGHRDAAQVASVGDTVSDLQAGANAGVAWNFGVLSGAHTEHKLREQPHTALLGSVADMPDWFSA